MRENIAVCFIVALTALTVVQLPAANGTLSGAVTVDQAGSPVIAGALVRTEGEPGYSAVSGTDGSYSMSAPAGTYNILVSAGGMNPQRTSVSIPSGAGATQSFALRKIGVSGMLVDLPAPLDWGEPPAASTPPGDDFPIAFSSMSSAPDPAAPQISEWNEIVKPDESFTMTGARFTTRTGADLGTDTTVWLWARTSAGGTLRQLKIWKVQENVLTALIPDDVPFGMYLVWVENSVGPSAPVCINRTTPRWIGPLGNIASPGDTKRIFGFNVSYNHGTATSYVYLQPASGGAFIQCSVTSVEPFAVAFTVPANLPVGNYRVFAHNGHGGVFGWGDGLPLTVQAPWVRGASESVVTPSGGDDRANLQNAIDLQSAQPSGGTVRLVAGTYKIYDQLWIKQKVRLVGAGMDLTNIELRGTIAGRHDYVRVWGDHIAVESLSLTAKLDSAVSPNYGILEGPYPEHDWSEANDIKYINMRLTGDIGTILTQNGLGYSRVESTGCEFYRMIDCGSVDGWMHGSNLYGGPYGWYQASPYIYFETEAGFSLGSRVVFENTHLETKDWPYDATKAHPYNYYDNLTADQYAYKIWCKRVTCPQIGSVDSYSGHLTTKDVAVQDNKGEMFLFHGTGGQWFGNVLSTNGLTLNLRTDGTVDGAAVNILNYGATITGNGLNGGQSVPDAVPTWLPTDGGWVVIVTGKGIGQARQIVSHTTTSVTVDKPWRVQPDPTSKIICTHLYVGHILYQNDLNALPLGYAGDNNYSASRGWDIDGNGWKFQAELNTSHRNWNGRSIFSNSGGPSYWCVARQDNAADCADCGMNMSRWEANPMGPTLLGNAFRSCQDNIYGNTNYYSGFGGYSGQGTGCMIENCSTYGGGLGYTVPLQTSGGYSTGGWSDGLVMYRKGNISVAKVSTNPLNPEPVYVSATDKKQFLIGNTYSGGSTTYTYASGVSSFYLLVPEYPLARFKGYPGETIPNVTIPIANAGTSSSSWSVGTPSQTWITATKVTSGNIGAEAESGQLRISVTTTALTAGKRWGYVPVTMGSQTVRIGVVLDLTSPIPVNGMKLWLEPDVGVTQDGSGNISAWADQSGSGNGLAQTTASSQPLFVSGAISGHGSVRFQGGDDHMESVGLPVSGTSQFTTIAYLKPASVTPPQTLFWQGDGTSTGGYGVYLSGSSNVKSGWGSASGEVASASPATAGLWSLIETKYDATTHKMWVNGALSGSVSKNNSNFTTGFFTLGNNGPIPVQGLSGDVAEVIVYGRALSDTERASVESYLRAKYGKPTARFTAAPSSGYAPLPVSFDASTSTDPEGSMASYAWNYGDGTFGSGVTASHTYSSNGSYSAVLTVTDADGNTSTSSATVTVFQPISAVSLVGAPASPTTVGTNVVLTAGATGGFQVVYRFLINDGSGWQTLRDFDAGSGFTWVPSVTGSYDVKVQGRNASSGNTYDAESPVLHHVVVKIPTSGMKLWLKGDAGITQDSGGLVSTWADQSSAGNNVSQANSGSQPVFVADGIHGQPAVRFQGTNDLLATSGLVVNGPSQFTTFALVKPTGSTPPQTVFWQGDATSTGGYGAYLSGTANMKAGWGGSSGEVAGDPVSTGMWYLISTRYDSSGDTLWLGGVPVGNTSKSNSNFTSGCFNLGNYGPSPNQGLAGDVAEVIVYNRALSDAERNAVESYLNTKYGKPAAQFTATPDADVVPLAVSFDAGGSSDPDGSLVSYMWSFGDGATGTGVTAGHTYASAGTFTASLTVVDDDGFTATASVPVTVYPQVSAVTVSASPVPPVGAGAEVTLTAASTGGYHVLYKFLVNDGSGWQTARDYQSGATCSWIPSKSGSYSLKAQARSASSGNAFEAESDPLPFTVAAIPTNGLNLWLKGDAGVTHDSGNLISMWADQSGAGNSVSQYLAQSKPVYVQYALNGKPAVEFVGGNCVLQGSGTVLLGSTPVTTFTVARCNSLTAGNYDYLWWAGTDSITGGYGVCLSTLNRLRAGWGSGSASITQPVDTAAGQWYRLCTRYASSTHQMWLDGSYIGQAIKGNSNLVSGIAVGNYAATSAYQGLVGEIAEILIYGRSLSDPERQAVEDYLSARWTAPAPLTTDKISDVKGMADGVLVSITSPKVVTVAPATFKDGGYYIEDPARSSAMKVVGGAVSQWDSVTLTGIVVTDTNGERVLDVEHVDSRTPTDAVGTLGMINKALTPSGRLVRVWGNVTSVGSGGFTIDDGSGSPVIIKADDTPSIPDLPNVGDYVAVTGIAGLNGGSTVVRTRGAADITILNSGG